MTEARFPNEPAGYREAREKLLQSEIELRAKVAEVAAERRKLPLGGEVKEDYVFQAIENGAEKDVKISELFAPGKDTLLLYSLMYGRAQKNPCPSCTSLIDYFYGGNRHHTQRINFAVCAAAPIAEFKKFADERGWKNVQLISSSENSYNSDYLAEDAEGGQMPMANIFVKRNGKIHHFWGTEMLHAGLDGHPRHMDQMWPLWNILDITPEGRGTDWGPGLSYS